ncbi:putative leader peptide [Kitasatospora sp. NPDC101801]|uniref:putative leader peptide n=1 Tax=unclassified Kitasatospora TaxID=2633591 RepID=UPI003818647C
MSRRPGGDHPVQARWVLWGTGDSTAPTSVPARPGFLPAGEHSLTRLRGAGTLRDVSRAVSLVGRLHVDLRRHASAICAVCR